jgi:hypothetical protein
MRTLRGTTLKLLAARAGRCRRAAVGVVALGIALLAGPANDAAAADPPPPSGSTAGAVPAPAPIVFGDDELIIREIFTSHLPTTLKKYELRLWVHPHFGDLVDNDNLRLTTGIRYGLTQSWEISASSDLYFSHGLRHVGFFDRYGAAGVQLGTKINLGQPVLRGWDTAAGVDYVFPTGRPPSDLTDGLRHLMPYLTFSHRLQSHRQLRIFWGLRLDHVTQTSTPGELGKNELADSSVGCTGGLVLDRKNWHYTFETSFDTTRLISHSVEDVFMIRPGVIWEIPRRHDPRVRSNWTVGASVKSTFGPGGTTLGAAFKLRYNLDLKSVWRHTPFGPAS